MAPFVFLPATAPPTVVLDAPAVALPRSDTAPHGWAGHKVRWGETVSGLAARYHSTVDAIAGRNHLGPDRMIRAGETIWVPRAESDRSDRRERRNDDGARRTAKRSAPTTIYAVRQGDTLWGIARAHGTTVTRLVKMNDLRSSRIVWVGAKLTVPQPRENTFAGRTYPDEIVDAAARNRERLADADVLTRSETKDLIVRTARRHGVDPALALAVSWHESGWNQRKVSVANAIGAMQVIPSSGEWASTLVGRDLDLLETKDNVTAGVVILRVLTRQADSLEEAIAGYYQGLASVERNGMYPDTKQYVANVMHHRDRW